jgi:rare lipoprotein A
MKCIYVATAALGLTIITGSAGIAAPAASNADPRQASSGHYDKAIQSETFAMPQNARSFVATASFYGGGPRRFEPNTHTASGERFNQWGLTAAHRTLPLGSKLLVTHRGRSVIVRVNDRGPAAWTGRSLDLSRGAATAIGLIHLGAGPVQVQVLSGS